MKLTNYTLEQISNCIDSNQKISDSIIERLQELNTTAGFETEEAMEMFIRGQNLRGSGAYIEALGIFDLILKTNHDCPEALIDAVDAIKGIQRDVEILALNDLTDLRIGKVYEQLKTRGEMSIRFISLVALHYLKIGQSEKGMDIMRKIKAISPNILFLNIEEEK